MKEGRRVILDIEANSLTPDTIWCVVAKDIDTKEVFTFSPSTPLGSHTEWQEEYLKFDKEIGTYIGHNFLGYDAYWMNKLLGTDIKVGQVIDTLVLSRLYRPVTPFKEQIKSLKGDSRLGGHGLGAWGVRLGFPKGDFHDFSKFSQEMLEYCIQDVEVNLRVYEVLMQESEGFSSFSVRLEHKVAWLLAQQERDGFYLDQDAATALRDEASVKLSMMATKLQEVFPPTPKIERENYEVVITKKGEMSKVSAKILDKYTNTDGYGIKKKRNGAYTLFRYETFNPKSSIQIAERLFSIGWVPKKLTPKGNPATDKETLSTAIDELMDLNPDLPGLVFLKTYNIVADRLQKSEKWLELVEEDGRVHGRVNPIGAGTHRCSHYADNMANIASVTTTEQKVSELADKPYSTMKKFEPISKSKIFLGMGKDKESGEDTVKYALRGIKGRFGWDSRACWAASDEEHCIVGADASGIQLRGLAHYMNDDEYIRALLEADIHKVNQYAAGIADRSTAKTFIYAWLLGAGDEKVGTIVGITEDEYDEMYSYAANKGLMNYHNRKDVTKQNLLHFVIGGLRRKGRKATRRLVATIIKGYKVKEQFLDRTPALKRLKTVDLPEATKRGFVLGMDGRKLWIPNEHLAMSLYLQGYEAVIMKLAMCLYQDELRKLDIPFKQAAFVHDEWQIETRWEYADVVGKACVDGIIKAGEMLGSNCPLDGEYDIGRSWAETH